MAFINHSTMFRFVLICWFCNTNFTSAVSNLNGQHMNPIKDVQGTGRQYIDVLSKITSEASALMKNRLQEFEKKLKLSTNFQELTRQRRSHEILTPVLSDYRIIDIKLEFTEQVNSVLVDFAFVETSTDAYLIGAGTGQLNGSQKGLSFVWKWNSKTSAFDLFATIEENSAVDIEAFTINDEAYFIFALNSRKNYMDFTSKQSKLYKITYSGVQIVRSIRTIAATKWKSIVVGKELFLFQASYLKWKHSDGTEKRGSYIPKGSTKVRIFKWFKNSFLEVDSILGSYTTDLEVASIMGKTFLAVANQTVTKKRVESTVLIYEITLNPSAGSRYTRLFQKINGWYISDLNFVQFGKELFLAIAYQFRVHNGQKIYQIDSIIFRFNGFFFVKYQSIAVACALQWTTLYGRNGEIALNLHSATSDQIYQFIDNSWTLQPVTFTTTLGVVAPNKIGFVSFVVEEKNYAVIAIGKTVHIFQLEFFAKSRDDLAHQLLESCNSLKKRVISLSDAITLTMTNISHVTLGTEQLILNKKIFLNTKIKELHLNVIDIKNNGLFQDVLKRKIQYFQDLFIAMTKRFESSLLRSKPQVLRNPVVLKNVHVNLITSNTARLNIVNNINFCEFSRKIKWLTTPMLNVSQLQFDTITFQNSVKISDGLINDVNIMKDVVHLHKTNNIIGTKIFPDGLFIKGNLNVIGSLNSVPFRNYLLTHSDQEIESSIEFHSDIEIESMHISNSSSINGIQWRWLEMETVKKNKPITFTGHQEFYSPLYIPKSLFAENINQINVNKMLDTAARLDEDAQFLQTVTFNNVTWTRNVEVQNNFNGIKIPRDLILLNSTRWNSSLTFEDQVTFQKLTVNGLVNNVKISKESVLTTSGEQNITAEVFFNEIIAKKVRIENTLNNVHLTKLLDEFKRYRIPAKVHYNHLKVKNLTSTKLSQDLDHLLNNGIRTDVPYHFQDHVTFQSLVHFRENVTTPSSIFSQFEPVFSLIPLKLANKVYSNLTFSNDINVNGLINGVDLSRLYTNTLLISGNQEVKSKTVFMHDIRIDEHIQVYGNLNDVKITDFVKINENITIDKLQFKDDVIFKGVTHIEQLNVQTIKEKLVEDWFDVLLTDSDQTVIGTKTFLHGINAELLQVTPAKHFTVVNEIYLEDINVEEVFAKTMQSNVTYETSETEFTADVYIEDLYVDIVDDVNVMHLLENALHYKENRCVKFSDEIMVENLVSSTINSVNVSQFLMNVVRRDENIFPGNLHITNVSALAVFLEGFVNDRKFSSDIVTTSSQNTIIPVAKYFQNANISDINITGLINNVNITNLESVLLKHDEQIINGTLNVKNLYLKGNLIVKNTIFDFNITEILKKAVFIDENVSISGFKEFNYVFYNPKNTNNLMVDELVDNTNLTYVLESMVTLDTEQTITGPLKFSNINVKYIKVPNILVSNRSKVTDVRLSTWSSSIMRINASHQTIKAKVIFQNQITMKDIVISGNINGLTLEDLMLTHKTQEITSALHFRKAVIKNMKVMNSFMGINLEDWFKHAVLKNSSSHQHIYANYTFSTIILEKEATFEQLLDNINISMIMTRQYDQTITATFTFHDLVVLPTRNIQIFNIQKKIDVNGVDTLFKYPLPFSCEKNEILYLGWCYNIILIENETMVKVCPSGEELVEPNEYEQQLLTNTGFILRGEKWFLNNTVLTAFICKTKANLIVEESINLKGQIYIKNITNGGKVMNLLSPMEQLFEDKNAEFLELEREVNTVSNFTSATRKNICTGLKDANLVLRNAYRPTTQFHPIQYFNGNILKIYLVQDESPKFLALYNEKLELIEQHWLLKTFITVASHKTEWRDTVVHIGMDTFFTERETIILMPIQHNCPQLMVSNIEVWRLYFPSYQIKLHKTSVETACILPTNIHLYILKEQSILFTANIQVFTMWKWVHDYGFKKILSVPTEQPIYFIRSLGQNGHMLVASENKAYSTVAIYQLNDALNKITYQTSMTESGKIEQIMSIPSSNMQLALITNGELKMIQYFPDIKKLITKQIISYPNSIQGLYYLGHENSYITVSSCGSTDFYSIMDSYLIHNFKSEITIEDHPRTFSYNNNFYIILKIAQGNRMYFMLLQASQMGPSIMKCQLPC